MAIWITRPVYAVGAAGVVKREHGQIGEMAGDVGVFAAAGQRAHHVDGAGKIVVGLVAGAAFGAVEIVVAGVAA